MTVRPVKLSDHEEWLSLRMALWPECPADQQLAEMLSYGDVGGSQIAFVAGVGHLSGFIEASLRQIAEGVRDKPRRIHRRHFREAGLSPSRCWPGPCGCC
jgi:hypothetical protein